MSFNKRIFTLEMLISRHKESPENSIESCVGRTDGFIFKDAESKEIITLWSDGKREEAYKLLEEHVLRVTDKIS